MSDPSQPPIIPTIGTVNANPAKDQTEAALRQFLALLAGAGLLQFLPEQVRTFLQTQQGAALLMSLAGLVAIAYGQWKTRTLATKAAQMAERLPDHLAQVK